MMEYYFYRWGRWFIEVLKDSRGVTTARYYNGHSWELDHKIVAAMRTAAKTPGTLERFEDRTTWLIAFAAEWIHEGTS